MDFYLVYGVVMIVNKKEIDILIDINIVVMSRERGCLLWPLWAVFMASARIVFGLYGPSLWRLPELFLAFMGRLHGASPPCRAPQDHAK